MIKRLPNLFYKRHIHQQKIINLKTIALAIITSLTTLLASSVALSETNVAGVEINVINDIDITGYAIDPTQSYLNNNATSSTQRSPSPSSQNPLTGNSASSGLASSNQPNSVVPGFNQANSDNLWQRIKDGYAMPELKSSYVDNHTSWYAARPEYLQRMAQRSQRYLYHIVEEVQKRGMPTEIALLPMVESAFNPKANSTSRASGIWQFIPSTGKNFGLKQDWWVDNRRGVTAATDAALTYLQKLHGMFGTWDLALAAYNAGEGTVQRAINRNRNKGLPTDYESLNLPQETRNYVPKLQAIKNIMSNPEQYGLKIDSIPNRPYFTKVNAPQQIDVHLAAKLAEISFDEFTALNPEYNRPVATARGNVHEILLPVSASQTFADNLSNYDKPLVSWQAYHAKRGERMDHIANKFGINVAQLREANGMSAGYKVASASTMLVPSNIASDADGNPDALVNSDAIDTASLENNNISATSDDTDSSKHQVMHKVKRGENIDRVAKKYGVNANDLMAQNSLKSGKLKAGQIIKVAYISKSNISKSKSGVSNVSKSKSGKSIHHSSRTIKGVSKQSNRINTKIRHKTRA